MSFNRVVIMGRYERYGFSFDGVLIDGVFFCGYRQSEGQKLRERGDYRLPYDLARPFSAMNIAIRSSSKSPVGIHRLHHS
jgi:hypothetical protein